MAFRAPMDGLGSLGSTTAISLAANPAALPVIAAVGGVAITIGAAKWTYDAWQDYKEKEHLKQIEAVNKLHHKHLETIIIFERNEIKGFPVIFKLADKTKAEDPDAYECIRFNDDDIEKMGESVHASGDVALNKYREYINDAILLLKDYYLKHTKNSQSKKKDVTTAVLSYLLYMLESKLANFSGFPYDIAYLDALIKFISSYSSLNGDKNTEHFSRLDPVRATLLAAKQELEKHQQIISLKGMIESLSTACVSLSKKLIRYFAMLITEDDKWGHVKTATFTEMHAGIVRKEYIAPKWAGFIPNKDRQIAIPESIFKDWHIWLLEYYEESINPDSPWTIDDIKPPDDVFILPDLAVLARQGEKWKSKKLRREIKEATDQLNSIRSLFGKCDNFVTMKLDPKTVNDAVPKFVHVTKDDELLDRAKVMANVATLTHEVISLQYLCVHLLKSLKQLGEIYVKNPRHFSLVFVVLDEICRTIQENVTQTRNAITRIQQQNANKGQLAAQEQFPEDLKNILNTLDATVTTLGNQVNDYRNKVSKNQTFLKAAAESVKHEMFEVAALFVRIFHIDHDLIVQSSQKEQDAVRANAEKVAVAQPAGRGVDRSSLKASIEENSFYHRHKYKIFGGIIAGLGILTMAVAFLISIASAGALSPIGLIVAGLGAKIGIAGLALAGVDALLGLTMGMFAGTVVDGAIVAGRAAKKKISNTTKSMLQCFRKNSKQSNSARTEVTVKEVTAAKEDKPDVAKPARHNLKKRRHSKPLTTDPQPSLQPMRP